MDLHKKTICQGCSKEFDSNKSVRHKEKERSPTNVNYGENFSIDSRDQAT